MRTTLTIEDGLDRKLRRLAARRGESYKETVNEALREGLLVLERPLKRRPFETAARSLGLLPGVDYDKVGQLADEVEDEASLRVPAGSRR